MESNRIHRMNLTDNNAKAVSGRGGATVPDQFLRKWQEMTDLLESLMNVPAVLIMRYDTSTLEVFLSSNSPGNPYHVGEKSHWSGLYCKTIIESQEFLMIPNALKDPLWDKNPDIELGMIAYLGFPVNYPDGTPFGTLCVLDRKETYFSDQKVNLLRHFRDTLQTDLAHMLESNPEMNGSHIDSIASASDPSNDKELIDEGFLGKPDSFFYYLYSHIADAIFYVDTKTQKVMAANQAACEIYGYTEEEFKQLSIADIDYEYDEKKVIQITHELVRNGRGLFEVAHKTKSGKIVEVEVKVVMLEHNYILAMARDISRRKEDERRLQELNKNKDIFLNLLSYDLKGSMNAILNYSELLVSKHTQLLTSELEEYYNEIHQSAVQTNQLLENLMLWTQLKTSDIHYTAEVFRVIELINDTVRAFFPQLNTNLIRIDDKETKDVWVKGDSSQLSKVINILLGNAIRYSPREGEISITSTKEGDFLRIAIADQGKGILSAYKDDIFKIESLLQKRENLNDPATGLSLVVCSELVEQNGGKITLVGEPDKGTEIQFTIPLATESEVDEVYNELKRETGY